MPTPSLIIDLQGSSSPIVQNGNSRIITRQISITNQGDRLLHVENILIESDDQASHALVGWGKVNPSSFDLQPSQQKFVNLTFTIPSHAPATYYEYDICVSTREGGTVKRRNKLDLPPLPQVIDQDAPNFHIEPRSQSHEPYRLNAFDGKPLKLTVMVENRSKQVDRFRVTCPDLGMDRFSVSVEYSDASEGQWDGGDESQGLLLTAGASGHITLLIKPLSDTPAGYYSSPLNIDSRLKEGLVLMDMLYLSVPVNARLTPNFSNKTAHVPLEDDDDRLALTLHNKGNVQRHLAITAKDDDRLFRYTFEPSDIDLTIDESTDIRIVPHVRKWWRRRWKTRQPVKFYVALENREQEDDLGATSAPLDLPKIESGTLLWEPYPAWFRWLIKGLAIALLVAIAAVLGRLALKVFIVTPRLRPRVLALSTPKETYTVRGSNPIPLDFELSNACKLEALQFIFANRDTQTTFETIIPQPPQDNAGAVNSQMCEQQDAIEASDNLRQSQNASRILDWLASQTEHCQLEQRSPGPLMAVAHFLVTGRGYTPLIMSCQGVVIHELQLVSNEPEPDPDRPDSGLGARESGQISSSPVFQSGTYEIEIKLLDAPNRPTTTDNVGHTSTLTATESSQPELTQPELTQPEPIQTGINRAQTVSLDQHPWREMGAATLPTLSPSGDAAVVQAAGFKGIPWKKLPWLGNTNPSPSSSHVKSVIHAKQLKNIQLVPAPPPQISYFYSKADTYRLASGPSFPARPSLSSQVRAAAIAPSPSPSSPAPSSPAPSAAAAIRPSSRSTTAPSGPQAANPSSSTAPSLEDAPEGPNAQAPSVSGGRAPSNQALNQASPPSPEVRPTGETSQAAQASPRSPNDPSSRPSERSTERPPEQPSEPLSERPSGRLPERPSASSTLPPPTVQPLVARADARYPSAPIELSWVIDQPWERMWVRLSYIAVTADGAIADDNLLSSVITPTNLGVLGEWCNWSGGGDRPINQDYSGDGLATNGDIQSSLPQASLGPDDNNLPRTLICEDVPTGVEAPGEYTFRLEVLTGDPGQEGETIVAETEPITIRAPFPEILSFTVNGQEAATYPQQVYFVSPARGSTDVMVQWKVANPDQVSVELLPAPGPVAVDIPSMPFSILPGNTTLTLQVTNAAGEMATQSVVLAAAVAPTPTLRPTVPIAPLPVAPPVPGQSLPLPPPPVEVQPGQLSEPLQVPPSGN